VPDLRKTAKQSSRKVYTPAMPQDEHQDAKQGRAGITDRGVKKALWSHDDEAEALRLRAFKDRRSGSVIDRQAVRTLLGIEYQVPPHA
jgi:hypothetical protein